MVHDLVKAAPAASRPGEGSEVQGKARSAGPCIEEQKLLMFMFRSGLPIYRTLAAHGTCALMTTP